MRLPLVEKSEKHVSSRLVYIYIYIYIYIRESTLQFPCRAGGPGGGAANRGMTRPHLNIEHDTNSTVSSSPTDTHHQLYNTLSVTSNLIISSSKSHQGQLYQATTISGAVISRSSWDLNDVTLNVRYNAVILLLGTLWHHRSVCVLMCN